MLAALGLRKFDDSLLVGSAIVGEVKLVDGTAEAEEVIDLPLGSGLVEAGDDDDRCGGMGSHVVRGKMRNRTRRPDVAVLGD